METEVISQRMQILESKIVNIRRVAIFATVCMLGLAILVFVQILKPTESIRARQLLIVNKSGQIVARIGENIEGTCFEMFGQTKSSSAVTCVGDSSGSTLQLTTHHGDSRVAVSAGGTQLESLGQTISPYFVITQNGKSLISASVGTSTTPFVGLADKMNVIRIVAPDNLPPSISITDSEGRNLQAIR